jgi:osmotically-inducible protein OsmY
MDDLLQVARRVSAELSAVVPETLAEAEQLAASIERAVQHETAGAIHNLVVEVGGGGVRLRGSCASYYSKQLAQHAAMATAGSEQLTNCIEVD